MIWVLCVFIATGVSLLLGQKVVFNEKKKKTSCKIAFCSQGLAQELRDPEIGYGLAMWVVQGTFPWCEPIRY